jgi:ribose transport system permease protein
MAENPPTSAAAIGIESNDPPASASAGQTLDTTPAGPSAPVGRRSTMAGTYISKYGLLLAFLITIIIFGIARPHTFPTVNNLKSILTLAAPSMILAVGLTVVLVMQDFDLSFGSMIGLAGGAATTFIVTDHWAWQLAIVVVLLLGVVAGLANGLMIAYLGGSSFIITLAMGTVLTGVEFALTHQTTVYQGYPSGFVGIASNSSILGLSNQIWIAAVIAVAVWILLDRTEVGRYMYAIGGNSEAARLSGLRVRPMRVLGFIIVGLAAAVSGILLISEASSYAPNGGVSYLLPAFAAVFLGAAVFRPGEFNLPGTVVGVLFLGVIQTGLIMLNLQTYLVNLVQGGILIAAVLVSRLGQRA